MKAFDTTDTMVYTVRKKLVEEGLDAVLSRKRRETPPVARIFDGEREAKLITLACSEPPPGFARWTLRLLEEKVVELQIVDRASDSTIGRVLKKVSSSPIPKSAGSFRPRRTPLSSRRWRTCWRSTVSGTRGPRRSMRLLAAVEAYRHPKLAQGLDGCGNVAPGV